MISQQDKQTFQERGILNLKGAVPGKKVKLAREALLAELGRLKLRVNGKWQTKQFEDQGAFRITNKLSQSISIQKEFNDLISNELLVSMNELAETKLLPAQPHPQILVSLPQKQPWSVPYLGWHLDITSPASGNIPGVQPFVLIDDLAKQGGATVAISGSHKLHGQKNSSAESIHQILRSDSVWGDLFSSNDANRNRFLTPSVVNGVELCVIEMWGKAGDVYLMDMRTLHAPALNAAKNARMMATNRYLAK